MLEDQLLQKVTNKRATLSEIKDEIIQKPRVLMTLKEFLLKEFLEQDDNVIFATTLMKIQMILKM